MEIMRHAYFISPDRFPKKLIYIGKTCIEFKLTRRLKGEVSKSMGGGIEHHLIYETVKEN